MMVRILALAAATLVTACALAACQALWDLPGQMRAPFSSFGAPPALPQTPDGKESLR